MCSQSEFSQCSVSVFASSALLCCDSLQHSKVSFSQTRQLAGDHVSTLHCQTQSTWCCSTARGMPCIASSLSTPICHSRLDSLGHIHSSTLSLSMSSLTRPVLGELNVSRSIAASTPPLSCKSPLSGTLAVGVGVSPRASVEDKENVPPMYDSSLHHPLIHADSDSDEEDPLAALDRMRREREAAAAVDEKEDEQPSARRVRDEDDEDDPFIAPSKLTVQRQRISDALARLAAEDGEEAEQKDSPPTAHSAGSPSSSSQPLVAPPPSPRSMPFHPPPPVPSLPTTIASFPYGPPRLTTVPAEAVRPVNTPAIGPSTSYKQPPASFVASPSSMQIESVSADVDLGAPRASITKKKADKRETKDIAGFFANRNNTHSPPAREGIASNVSALLCQGSNSNKPTSSASTTASYVPAATMPYGPPLSASTLASKLPPAAQPPPPPSTAAAPEPRQNTFFTAKPTKKASANDAGTQQAEVAASIETTQQSLFTPKPAKRSSDQQPETRQAEAAEERKKRSRDDEKEEQSDKAAGASKAKKDGEDSSPRKAIELFTTNEDDDEEDDLTHLSTAAATDIEAQLMEGDDDGLEDKQENQQEPVLNELMAATAGQTETRLEDNTHPVGEGAEEMIGDAEGEVDVEEDEEQLAAELLAEDEEEDDEEHRLAARNQLAALNDNSDVAARHATFEEEAEEDSNASHSSDEEEGAEEDWVALQAEDDKQRRARLDQLHLQTEQVIRDAAQPFKMPHSLLENRGEAVNARYARLLQKVREREKAVGGVVKYIGETQEEERRRKKREERERREREQATEDRPAVVEKEVDGEMMLEIDVDELENEEIESENEEEEEEDEEVAAEIIDERQDDRTTEGSRDAEASAPSPTAAVSPNFDGTGGDVDTTTTPLSTRPLSEVVAEQTHRAAASLPSPVVSDESTQSESDKSPPPTSAEDDNMQHAAQAAQPVAEVDDDLIDDDMDDEMKAMIRKAQATRKRKREQQAALTAQQPPQQQQPEAEPSPVTTSASATPVASPEPNSPTNQLAPHTHSKTIALPSTFNALVEQGAAQQQREDDWNKTKRRKSESMVEDEAEDDDLVGGRRGRNADDDELESDNSKNEYEEDGFMVHDADANVEPVDDTTRQVHAEVDREKDEREVAAIASRFAPCVQPATRAPSNTNAGTVNKSASDSLTRRGSDASSTSSSPSKCSPSPSSLPTPPLRSVSIVTGSLLDEDRADSSEEEEEVDENSTARKNKRATLQYRARMLRKPPSLLTAPASSSSPQSSPIKSLSGFDLLDEMTLSSAAVMAAPSPPLSAPIRRGSVVKEKANDFSALHAEITRQRSLIRHNSFLIERTSSLVGSASTTTVTAAAGGGVSVKSVSLSKSYIFRRVADENNENTAHKRSTSPSSAAQPAASADRLTKPHKGGKKEQQEVAKCAVAGSVVLAQLQRSKTLSPALLAARMGRRPSGSMLTAFAKPTTVRAVSDR